MPRSALAASLAVALLAAPRAGRAQDVAPRLPAERAQYEALLRAQDARAHADADLATLRAGLHASNPMLRRVAVRAVGRLEREALIPDAVALLADPVDAVRAAAADAVAQDAAHGGAPAARAALLARLDAERDPAVRGALAEAFGRLPQGDTTQVRATAERLAALAGDGAPAATIYGVARGLFLMTQQPAARGALPAAAVARLGALLTHGLTPASADPNAVAVRELAAGALAAARAATEPTYATILADPAPGVRRIAPRGIALLADTAAARRIARRALDDRAPVVRGLAVTGYARRFAAERRCSTALAVAHDPDPSTRMDAVDALGIACDDRAPVVALLDSLAGTLPAPRGDAARDGGAWHLPAHALVSLAAQDPARARARLGAFVASPAFFVRDYAARAAARAADTATLRRLATDPAPNVRTSALAGLETVLAHGADDVYLAALGDADSQVLQTAAHALGGSRDPRATDALLAALDRVTATRSETSRDARMALLERVKELGAPASAARLRPYLADFDT
ncbi:MAG: HEAT repeat domain-containing protein, partial [Gemmatirosa sp.]|nr:HEAT repeat domain-containing protein [Gemmatirosa sp.]